MDICLQVDDPWLDVGIRWDPIPWQMRHKAWDRIFYRMMERCDERRPHQKMITHCQMSSWSSSTPISGLFFEDTSTESFNLKLCHSTCVDMAVSLYKRTGWMLVFLCLVYLVNRIQNRTDTSEYTSISVIVERGALLLASWSRRAISSEMKSTDFSEFEDRIRQDIDTKTFTEQSASLNFQESFSVRTPGCILC